MGADGGKMDESDQSRDLKCTCVQSYSDTIYPT